MIIEIIIVWIKRIIPIDRGWFMNKNDNDNVKFNDIIIDRISENSLNKILILEINDRMLIFSLKF